jgi:hypothetical protein
LDRGGSRKFRKRGPGQFGKNPYTGMWKNYEIFWEYACLLLTNGEKLL